MARIFVGLSGGVDSAVSAALLKRDGHEVIGGFIKIWSPEFIECTWREDRLDAMRVCAALDIPFREIDLSDAYKEAVISTMVRDYAAGITPNPDVLCNRDIKFGPFLSWAISEGADFVATGHYARTIDGVLFRGTDRAKDQSYFLHQLTRDQLKKILFPIGDKEKSRVRALARDFALPVAAKSDSQGLCFVGDITLPEFLAHYIPLAPGVVLDGAGSAIGEHDGAALYTLGQRHGYRIRSTIPHFVIATNAEANTITVSPHRADALTPSVRLADMHWIGDAPSLPASLDVQNRYREHPVRAHIDTNAPDVRVMFDEPHLAARGQSLVAYRGDECLGGGPITALAD